MYFLAKNMNTTKIVNDYKNSIQREIDMKQKVLDDINQSMKSAEEFLLDNGFDTITDEVDIISSVMNKISELNQGISIFEKDISSIKESIKTLSSISKGLDPAVATSLNGKIKELELDISVIKDKLSSTSVFLPALLNLQIVCPMCSGSTLINKKTCDYCAGVGVIGIEKVLRNEKQVPAETSGENFSTYRIKMTQASHQQ